MPVPSHVQRKLDTIRDARPVTPRGSCLSRPKPTFTERAARIGPHAYHKIELHPRAKRQLIHAPKSGIPAAPSYGQRSTPSPCCTRPSVGARPSPNCHRSKPNAVPLDLRRHRERKTQPVGSQPVQLVRVFGVLVPLPSTPPSPP